MNILGNGNVPTNNGNGLSPQLMQSVQQVKGLMGMANGNPMALMQSNPQIAQVLQMCKGQNPQKMVEQLCKQQGIDMYALINELKR